MNAEADLAERVTVPGAGVGRGNASAGRDRRGAGSDRTIVVRSGTRVRHRGSERGDAVSGRRRSHLAPRRRRLPARLLGRRVRRLHRVSVRNGDPSGVGHGRGKGGARAPDDSGARRSRRPKLLVAGSTAARQLPHAPRCADDVRRRADRRRHPVAARGQPVRGRADRACGDLRDAGDDRDRECGTLQGDQREEPRARGREPAQVRVPRSYVARAADAAERRDRLLAGPARPPVRRGEPEAGALPAEHPPLWPTPLEPHQRRARRLEGRGGSDGTRHRARHARRNPGRRADARPRAGERPRADAHARHRARSSGGISRRAPDQAGRPEPRNERREVHAARRPSHRQRARRGPRGARVRHGHRNRHRRRRSGLDLRRVSAGLPWAGAEAGRDGFGPNPLPTDRRIARRPNMGGERTRQRKQLHVLATDWRRPALSRDRSGQRTRRAE